MTWKVINISNPGTSTKFGSDDMDKISNMLNGNTNVDSVSMNSEWSFRDSKFKLRDSDNTHDYTFRTGNLTGNREISIPVILANDAMCLAGVNNNFITQQTIRDDLNNDVLYLYRNINTNGSQVQLNFDMNDSASNRDTYVDLDAKIVDNTSGSEDGRLDVRVVAAGNKHEMFRIESDMIRFGDINLYGQLAATGLTALRTYTFPDVTTKLAGLASANTFTAAQKIDLDTTNLLVVRRDTNTATSEASIQYIMEDSANADQEYAREYAEIVTNTAGSETGFWEVQTVISGFVGSRLRVNSDGDLSCGANNRVRMRDDNISAQRTYDFVDYSDIIPTGYSSISNPYISDITGASVKRQGMWTGMTSTNSEGILATGCTAINNTANYQNTTEGHGQTYATGAVANNNAGLRWTSTRFRREWGNYMIVRLNVSSTSDIRIFVGWSSDTNEIAGETTLNNFSGAGVGKRTGDTNWFTMVNDGDATEDRVDTGVAFSTSTVTIQLGLDATSFRGKIGSTSFTAGAADKTINILPIWVKTGAVVEV